MDALVAQRSFVLMALAPAEMVAYLFLKFLYLRVKAAAVICCLLVATSHYIVGIKSTLEMVLATVFHKKFVEITQIKLLLTAADLHSFNTKN